MAAREVHPDRPHKYMRIKYGKSDAFKCQHPGCTHFLTHPELAIGRESECWRCGNIFIIVRNDVSFYAKKLKCGECQPVQHDKKFEGMPVNDLLKEMGIEVEEE